MSVCFFSCTQNNELVPCGCAPNPDVFSIAFKHNLKDTSNISKIRFKILKAPKKTNVEMGSIYDFKPLDESLNVYTKIIPIERIVYDPPERLL